MGAFGIKPATQIGCIDEGKSMGTISHGRQEHNARGHEDVHRDIETAEPCQ